MNKQLWAACGLDDASPWTVKCKNWSCPSLSLLRPVKANIRDLYIRGRGRVVRGRDLTKSFCRVFWKNRHRWRLLFFSTTEVTRLFLLKVVKPSPERKIIKLRTCNNLFPPLRHWRPLDSRTRTTTSARFDLKFSCVLPKKIHTPEWFIVLFLREKLAVCYLYWKRLSCLPVTIW